MLLPRANSKAARNKLLVLGHIRKKSEFFFLRKFILAARLCGIHVNFGRFHDFRDQSLFINKFRHKIIWKYLLGSSVIRGYVNDDLLGTWVDESKFMLTFRSEDHLNSAIPYTAISNGLIPIGRTHCNSKEFMQRMKIPYLQGSGFIDMIRYILKVKKMTFESIPTGESKMSIECLSSALSTVFDSELKSAG